VNKKFTRLCLGILSTALLSSISSVNTVNAAENSLTENYIYEVQEDGSIRYYINPIDNVEEDVIEAPVYYEENIISTLSLGENEDGQITFTSFEDLKELTKSTYTSSMKVYYASEEPLIIKEDITIPDRLAVYMNEQTLIVPQDVTLTVSRSGLISINQLNILGKCIFKGTFYVDNEINVYGSLDNTGFLRLNRDSKLIILESGKYTGSGAIMVYCADEDMLSSFIQGIDVDKFKKEFVSTSAYWILTEFSGLIKLGTPTDLTWGVEYEKEVPGLIAWTPVIPEQGKYEIKIYKEGEDEYCVRSYYSFGNYAIPERRCVNTFRTMDLESGTYYFTLMSRGDNATYVDSEIAISDTWTYTKPDDKLESCTDLSWNWPRLFWEGPADELCGGYDIDYYFAANENERPRMIGGASWYTDIPNDYISDSKIQAYGNGYYYYRVRPISADITVKCNGEWSELSEPYILSELSQSVENELNSIIESVVTAEEARTAVQELDTEELKSAMLADQSNTGTVDKIAELEEFVGGAAAIDVDEEVPAFDAEKVSIIGANLNNAASETEPITLVINKPERENIIPEAYSNALAVRFSMTLDNVEDTENLKVPVKITLPVPETINPGFLVILHYHAATNEVEELNPYVYNEDGQYYASFVLTSFSDFVMTQPAPEIRFEDVEEGAYYEQAVKWAVERGITNGYGSDTIFNPEGTCTRGQIVTFLWRANGSPEPASLENPFTDVPDNEYYYKAVLWAVENGITAGYGCDTIFNPDGACTRAQVATFMWRAAGKPDMSDAENPFTDLEEGSFYYDAVLWAVENGITNGHGSSTTFCPELTCTRGQIVTFLYRGMN